MIRELLVNAYLIIFQVFFTIFKLFPLKDKTTFVVSFGDNALYIIRELEKLKEQEIIVLKTKKCKVAFNKKTLLFEVKKPLDWIASIYHLATSKNIFVDDYYGFLAVSNFKTLVTCTQLWHANGAIKKFGLKDLNNQKRTKSANKRFLNVYQNFHYVICGSEKMGNIFKESFNLSNERILKIGIPKTDFYFDDTKKEKIIKKMTEKYPVINNKKLILYAPTFRDHQLQSTSMILDIDKMYKEFSDKFVLFIRMHPSVKYELENHYQDFLYDVSTEKEISDLLLITDLLITDYSSIPMEFSLLKKPMIFFAYDLEDYAKTRGLWEDYDKLVPGPVVKNMEKLIENIKNETYDYKKIEEFAKDWNEYSNGCSSKNVVDTLYSNKKGSV